MAKGTSTGETMIRTGCKRELQFMLKSQSEICGGHSLSRTRGSKISISRSATSTDIRRITDATTRVLLRSGIKKMRLVTKDKEAAAMSDFPVEEEEEKSDVVDEEGKGSFYESAKKGGDAVRETVKECYDMLIIGSNKDIINQTKNMLKGTFEMKDLGLVDVILGREFVLACPASFSELAKLTSRSCLVKLKSGLSYENPGRRLTRSMFKSECINSKANVDVDEDRMNPEREAKDISEECCVDAGTLVACGRREEEPHEQNCVDPIGLSQTSGLRRCGVKKAVNDTVDRPLRRLTRSLVKQDSPDLESNTGSSDLGKVDVHANDVDMDDFQNLLVTTPNKRGRPRKFIRSFPAKLKELFDSRILEGLTVYYLRCAKMREAGARGLKGVIKGSGILCFRGACKGTQVVSPAVYEHHASSTNKRSPEYILLESGFTLRDVMNACKETPFDTLEEKLRAVVGPDLKKSSLCFSCQGPLVEPCETKSLFFCKACLERKEPELPISLSKATGVRRGYVSSFFIFLQRLFLYSSIIRKRENPTQKSPEPSGTIPNEFKSSSIKSSSQKKLTRNSQSIVCHFERDLRLHKLVFEDDILPDGTKVGYFVAGKVRSAWQMAFLQLVNVTLSTPTISFIMQKMLVGYKKGFGIHCSCCNKVVSPSAFEAHAGCASRRKPFQHIYTTNGVSLHELSVALSMDQKFSIRENDDICRIFQDGGELLCCDTCPRSYHIVCAGLSSLPSERWSCKYCVNMIEREKFVDSNLNAVAAGRVNIDIFYYVIGNSFSRLGFNSRTVILCDQCEKVFHVGCLKDHNITDLKELHKDKWFCSLGCKKINTSLGDLIVQGEEKLSNNFLNFIRKKQKPNEESCPDDNTTPNIRCRIISGKLASSDDTKEFLKKALLILHERFDPICESGTRGDLVPAMVYGKKAKGHDFSGMYCTMLTVDEVIVSVGIFRVLGSELAELPLVATTRDYQGQGYFQCLFDCIERLLGSLNVKQLVLPAADEAKSIWTDKFGFTKMMEEEVKECRKEYSVMVFHGTSMLRKMVPGTSVADGSKPEDNMEE
uniref:PHD-type domain-containing protein n=1 Tax=Brassica oleracea TaxID=3712 RepID=A0A3P6C1Y4_BRAOL|nr:unnamed protein product [Brassica oleracea]